MSVQQCSAPTIQKEFRAFVRLDAALVPASLWRNKKNVRKVKKTYFA